METYMFNTPNTTIKHRYEIELSFGRIGGYHG